MTEPRIPPHDSAAEVSVVAACLLSQEALDAARALLEPADMYEDRHRRIVDAIYALDDDGKPVDLTTVAGKLRDTNRLAQIGGTPFLAQIAGEVPAVAHVETYARTVAQLARVRRVISESQRIAAEGYAAEDPEKFCAQAEASISDAVQGGAETTCEDVATLIPRVADDIGKRREMKREPGTTWGWKAVDRAFGKLGPYVHILAGRPGMGKSAAAQGMCVNCATSSDGGAALFVSLEMEKEQIAERMLSAESKTPSRAMRTGDITPVVFVEVQRAAERLRKIPMAIEYCPGATVGRIRAVVRRKMRELCRAHNTKPGLVAIDYLQLIDDQMHKGETRDQAIGRVMRALVKLAADLRCPVVTLSQLNRSVETRSLKDKRPQLSDLRESGNIEQDATSVVFVYRDDYYHPDSPDKGIAELIAAKLRGGRTGVVRLKWTGEWTRFDDLAGDEYEFDEYDGSDNA